MKTYYCVISSFENDGTVTADIVDTVQAAEKPEGNFTKTRYSDIYSDWFESVEEAKAFIRETNAA